MTAATTKVSFTLTLPESLQLQHGQAIFLCGNHELLGGGDRNAGIQLSRADANDVRVENGQVFTTTRPISVPTQHPLRYRYAIYENGFFREWEPLPGNEMRSVAPSGRVSSQEDTWGLPTIENLPEVAEPVPPPFGAPEEESAVKARLQTVFGSERKLFIITDTLPLRLRGTRIAGQAKRTWVARWVEDDIRARTPNSIAYDISTVWCGIVTRDCIELQGEDGHIEDGQGQAQEAGEADAGARADRRGFNESPAAVPAGTAASGEGSLRPLILQPTAGGLGSLSLADLEHQWTVQAQASATGLHSPQMKHKPSHGHLAGTDVASPTHRHADQVGPIHITSPGRTDRVGGKHDPAGATLATELSQEDLEEITRVLNAINVVPVFLPTALHATAAEYHQAVLKPCMHNVLETGSQAIYPRASSLELQSLGWAAFCASNEAVARTVLSIFGRDDVAWIHDYGLAMLPSIMSREFQRTQDTKPAMVFYMHAPFPTSEIFRTLHVRDEILQSLLQCDMVGFHTFNYARHFLHAAKRLLGVASRTRRGGSLALDVAGREVLVGISHVGVEATALDSWMASDEAAATARHFASLYPGKVIIAGFDSCQRLSGCALKLLAFEKLLEENPVYRRKVVLVQRCETRGALSQDVATTSKELTTRVAEINATFAEEAGGPVVDYVEAPWFSPQYRVGLFHQADVLLQTPLREGLNMLSLEYTYVRTQWQIVRSRAIAEQYAAEYAAAQGSIGKGGDGKLAAMAAGLSKRGDDSARGRPSSGSGASGSAAAAMTGVEDAHVFATPKDAATPVTGPTAAPDQLSGLDANIFEGTVPASVAASLKAMYGMPGYYASLATPPTARAGGMAGASPPGTVSSRSIGAGVAASGSSRRLAGAFDPTTSPPGSIGSAAGPGGGLPLPGLPPAFTARSDAAAAGAGVVAAGGATPTSPDLATPGPTPTGVSPVGGGPVPALNAVTGLASNASVEETGAPEHQHCEEHGGAEALVAPLPPPTRGGCVILSEFAMASNILNSNLVVNPWSIRNIAREIDKALLMPDHERSFRQWRDYQYAIRNPSASWSRSCISDVVEIRAEREAERLAAAGALQAASAAAGLAAASSLAGSMSFASLPSVSAILSQAAHVGAGGGASASAGGLSGTSSLASPALRPTNTHGAGGHGATTMPPELPLGAQAAGGATQPRGLPRLPSGSAGSFAKLTSLTGATLAGATATAQAKAGTGVPVLDVTEVVRAFKASKRHALFVDYGGTLVGRELARAAVGVSYKSDFHLDGYSASIPQPVLEAVSALSAASNNTVYVVSGLRSTAVDVLNVSRLPHVGLAAENGMYVSLPEDKMLGNTGVMGMGSGEGPVPGSSAHLTGSTPEALRYELSQQLGSPASTEASSAPSGPTPMVTPGAESSARGTWPIMGGVASPHTVRTVAMTAQGGDRPAMGSPGGRPMLQRSTSVRGTLPTSPSVRHWVNLLPPESDGARLWESLKARAIAIATEYTWRVNGSAVRTYDSLLVWDYRNADAEWAQAQAKFLAEELEEVAAEAANSELARVGEEASGEAGDGLGAEHGTSGSSAGADDAHAAGEDGRPRSTSHTRRRRLNPVKVTVRKSRVEFALRDMNKGRLVSETLRRLTGPATDSIAQLQASASPQAPDFVLVVGDDTTDEDMFTAVAEWADGQTSCNIRDEVCTTTFTVTVGRKARTAAQAYCVDVPAVHQLLIALAQAQAQMTREREAQAVGASGSGTGREHVSGSEGDVTAWEGSL